jgi:hypothetical protein
MKSDNEPNTFHQSRSPPAVGWELGSRFRIPPFWTLCTPTAHPRNTADANDAHLTYVSRSSLGVEVVFFYFDHFSDGRTHRRVIRSSQSLYLNTGQHKHRINRYTYQTSMPCAGFEPTIPTSEREKTAHACLATVTGMMHYHRINFVQRYKQIQRTILSFSERNDMLLSLQCRIRLYSKAEK